MLSESDALLLPYLRASDEEVDRTLSRVIRDHADPVMTRVVTRMLGLAAGRGPGRIGHKHSYDSQDVCSQARVQLVARLQDLRAGRASEPIRNFRAYVAAVAYQACAHYLRTKHPRRERLKNQLRCVFARHQGLAIWDAKPVGWLCGYSEWRDRSRWLQVGGRYQDLLGRYASALSGLAPANGSLADLAVAVLNWVGGPVELEDLTNAIAQLLCIRDEPVPAHDGAGERVGSPVALDEIPEGKPDLGRSVARRLYIERLWREVEELPDRQRHAVLLSLDEIAVFPGSGVSSLAQIAAALAMPEADLAALWPDLPLEDSVIAGRLEITRQQVINLRKSARARLARRMRDWEW
jgi:DNA-directed RNA polymerase specialized sigma24 family protein